MTVLGPVGAGRQAPVGTGSAVGAAPVSCNGGPVDLDPLVEVAEAVVESLRPVTEYVQVFVESTCEVRREFVDAVPIATLVEVRQGIGCLVQARGGWRYRHFLPSQLPEIAGWIPGCSARAVRLEVPGRNEQVSPVPSNVTWPNVRGKLLDDHVVRCFAVADSTGLRSGTWRETVRRRAEVEVYSDGVCGRGFSRWVGTPQTTDVSAASPQTLSVLAAGRASDAVRARHWGRRRTDVVFGPSAGAGFLHELIGHALEADNLARSSPYARKLLRPGAVPESLLLVDDPTYSGGYGSYDFDDEGQPAVRTVMAANGSVQPLTSVRTAKGEGMGLTGNGRRQDYRNPALPRASNTVVVDGIDDDATILTPTPEGVLVIGSLGAGEINVVTGEFVFAALDSYILLPDGDYEPVRDLTLVGDACAVLRRLEAIGRHTGDDNITCGKQGQFLGIGLRSPLMRFADVDWTAA